MRTLTPVLASATVVGLGWLFIASAMRPAAAAGYVRAAIVHPSFDPGRIEREITFHRGRVARDPGGPLGWSMLSAAYLAKSKELDTDQAAWDAENASRHSLKLRRRNNASAAKRLVQSLLEQHRFQDALLAANDAIAIDPSDEGAKRAKIDCLIEIGKLDEAKKELAMFPASDGAMLPERARIASLEGRHDEAISYLKAALAPLDDNMDVGPEGLAWFHVKIAAELTAMNRLDDAEAELTTALRMHPRNYKACLGMAKIALARGDANGGARWSLATLKISNSLEAKSLLVRSSELSGNSAQATYWTQRIVSQWVDEDARYGRLRKGGPLSVRPEDRAFATFAAGHLQGDRRAELAARRDLRNRPDAVAVTNAKALGVG